MFLCVNVVRLAAALSLFFLRRVSSVCVLSLSCVPSPADSPAPESRHTSRVFRPMLSIFAGHTWFVFVCVILILRLHLFLHLVYTDVFNIKKWCHKPPAKLNTVYIYRVKFTVVYCVRLMLSRNFSHEYTIVWKLLLRMINYIKCCILVLSLIFLRTFSSDPLHNYINVILIALYTYYLYILAASDK